MRIKSLKKIVNRIIRSFGKKTATVKCFSISFIETSFINPENYSFE